MTAQQFFRNSQISGATTQIFHGSKIENDLATAAYRFMGAGIFWIGWQAALMAAASVPF